MKTRTDKQRLTVGWKAKVTTAQKAMAFDLLATSDQVPQNKVSHALWIAFNTLKIDNAKQ